LPVFTGENSDTVHEHLFFDGDDGYWSVRAGDWKLVSNEAGELELYNLNDDIGESVDLAARNEAKVVELNRVYQSWCEEMGPRIAAKGG